VKDLFALLGARAGRYVSGEDLGDLSELGRYVGEHRAELARGLAVETMAAALADDLVRGVERRQQFRASEAGLRGQLELVLGRSLAALVTLAASDQRELGSELARVFQREALEVRALLGVWLSGEASVCAEYSAELQLELLGISLEALQEPILDLGCGEQAELVRRCRAAGKIATGLDRHGQGPDVIQADWLEHAFPEASLGTILSHQAFSLHFLRHHLGSGAQAEAYARKYMELLAALKPGGSFVYAPGLPFVEQHLPARKWRMRQTLLPSPLREAVDSVFSDRVGARVAYACRVTRLAGNFSGGTGAGW